MKAIVMSIQSQHAYNILIGNKTMELRKSVPKDFVGWVYVYVTKASPYIADDYYTDLNDNLIHVFENHGNNKGSDMDWKYLNCKVVARFWFDGYEKLRYDTNYDTCIVTPEYYSNEFPSELLLKKLCLTYKQISKYLGYGNISSAMHIKNLEIFDTPKELEDFNKYQLFKCEDIYDREDRESCLENTTITKAPQSYQYVEIIEKLKGEKE